MEGCFLLTGGQPCRDRSEEEEDNKDIGISKGKYNKRLATSVCDFLLSFTVSTNTS